jgi:hypothetical protein
MKRLARAAMWSVIWTAVALAARGAGLACLQACSGGLCSQAFCGPVASGGSCECFSGAAPWGTGGAYAAYCGAWGKPAPGCSSPAAGISVAPPPSLVLSNAAAMRTALASQNPYLATLVRAIQKDGGWVAGEVQGLIHDAHQDPATSTTIQEPAVAFVGQVTPSGGDVVEVDITVQGDISQLVWLKGYCNAMGAVPPTSVHGTVSAGGSHGSLQVVALGGGSQSVQW